MAILAVVTPASAQTAGEEGAGRSARIKVAIVRQSLSNSLRQLAEASGMQLIYDSRMTDGKTAPTVSGTMTPREALAAVLAGSGLTFQFSGDRSAIISALGASTTSASDDGVRAVGVVSVEGASGNMPFGDLVSPINGTNGSRDVQATEGTGSYATGAASIASKVPLTLRETPQSISVMTSQQIADQSLVTVRNILDKITGVTVTDGGNNEEFNISSRGFAVTTFTFDGGAPVSFAYNNRPVIDIAQYDSLQLVRGANGTYAGYSDPGGTVNLVRKKPLDHKQFMFEQDVGSWANFRSEGDITGPITADGKLRARAVASRTDKKYFFDIAEGHKTSIYGVIEYDVTPTTLFTLGASHVREDNVPNQGGLPRYSDGAPIDFPVSTCLCSPYAYEHPRRTEVFGSVDQQIGKNVTAKLSATYSHQNVSALYLNSSSTVLRGQFAAGSLGGYSTDNPLRQLAIDFYSSANFKLLGRSVQLILGGNYQSIKNSGGQVSFYEGYPIPDIFNYDPYALPKPKPYPDSPFLLAIKNDAVLYGAYASIKFEILKNLHVSSAWRYNSYSDEGIFKYSFSDEPTVSPVLKDSSLSRPNIGVTFDFLKSFTLYGSYQSTYQIQQEARSTASVVSPPPIIGVNEEIGLKWQSRNGILNASLSLYNIVQNGFLITDYSEAGGFGANNTSALRNITSRGVDFEIAGEIAKGLQVSVGYSYNDNKIEQKAIGFSQGALDRPNASTTPHHLLKTWTTYRGGKGSILQGLILGGGVNWQSNAYNRGLLCADPPVRPGENALPCSRFYNYNFITKGYATLALKIGYQLSRNIEISVNGDNLTDVRTFSTNPGQNIVGYNSYIQPRSILGSLRMVW